MFIGQHIIHRAEQIIAQLEEREKLVTSLKPRNKQILEKNRQILAINHSLIRQWLELIWYNVLYYSENKKSLKKTYGSSFQHYEEQIKAGVIPHMESPNQHSVQDDTIYNDEEDLDVANQINEESKNDDLIEDNIVGKEGGPLDD